jgi:hypothetical protein
MAQTMCANCSSHLSPTEIRCGCILCSKCEKVWRETVLRQFQPQLEKLRAANEAQRAQMGSTSEAVVETGKKG